MKSWEDEQRDYYLDKSDSEQMAAFFLGGIVVIVIVATLCEAWQRFFG